MDFQRIGSYRVVRQLGRGGMGTVYQGVQDEIERHAAIKVLLPEFSKDADVSTRFFNEARAANIIRHPGIVNVFEFGRLPDGSAYIVMELLEGETLKARLKRLGTAAAAEAPRLCRQIASALAAAHQKGIIHRDLKPENVMLVPDPEVAGGERVKVLDFGLAKLADEHRRPEDPEMRTRTGITMGTPTYMSPEQCRGSQVTDKTDVYALGVMLYQFLSGRPPFVGAEGQVIGAHLYVEPRPLAEAAPWADRRLVALAHTMLCKDAEPRPSMAEVAKQLEAAEAAQKGNAPQEGAGTSIEQMAGQRKDPAERSGKPRSLAGTLTMLLVMGGVTSLLVVGSGVLLSGPKKHGPGPIQQIQQVRQAAAAADMAPASAAPADLAIPQAAVMQAPAAAPSPPPAPAVHVVKKQVSRPPRLKDRKGVKEEGPGPEDITNAKLKPVD